jgi:hypothetical protein
MCGCEESAHASNLSSQKQRTFTISGSISVLESVCSQSCGQASENSQGCSEKDTISETSNASGLGLALGAVELSCPSANI